MAFIRTVELERELKKDVKIIEVIIEELANATYWWQSKKTIPCAITPEVKRQFTAYLYFRLQQQKNDIIKRVEGYKIEKYKDRGVTRLSKNKKMGRYA